MLSALARGWIDSQKRALDDSAWLQRFTPRRARSRWSKVNREKAEALIARGGMHAPGLAEVDRAKRDGRWAHAYDSARAATVPADLAAALAPCEEPVTRGASAFPSAAAWHPGQRLPHPHAPLAYMTALTLTSRLCFPFDTCIALANDLPGGGVCLGGTGAVLGGKWPTE